MGAAFNPGLLSGPAKLLDPSTLARTVDWDPNVDPNYQTNNGTTPVTAWDGSQYAEYLPGRGSLGIDLRGVSGEPHKAKTANKRYVEIQFGTGSPSRLRTPAAVTTLPFPLLIVTLFRPRTLAVGGYGSAFVRAADTTWGINLQYKANGDIISNDTQTVTLAGAAAAGSWVAVAEFLDANVHKAKSSRSSAAVPGWTNSAAAPADAVSRFTGAGEIITMGAAGNSSPGNTGSNIDLERVLFWTGSAIPSDANVDAILRWLLAGEGQ